MFSFLCQNIFFDSVHPTHPCFVPWGWKVPWSPSQRADQSESQAVYQSLSVSLSASGRGRQEERITGVSLIHTQTKWSQWSKGQYEPRIKSWMRMRNYYRLYIDIKTFTYPCQIQTLLLSSIPKCIMKCNQFFKNSGTCTITYNSNQEWKNEWWNNKCNEVNNDDDDDDDE